MKTTKENLLEMEMKQRDREARKKYRELAQEHVKLKKDMEALLEMKNSNRSVHIIKRGNARSDTRAVAFAVASDWHVEEIVNPRTVNGLNKYNPEIAQKRADYFFTKVASMVKKEQQDVHIERIILALLGDFISSNIHEELLENCAMRPIEAIMFAEELISSGIEFLLENTDCKLTIPCTVGNHSRINSKVHISTESGNSLETMMYHHLNARHKSDRVEFVIEEGYHTYLDLFGYIYRLHHGHAIKYNGGVGGLTIPMNKAIAAWNLTCPANVDVIGH